jgi:SHAQKYF class myb-like DNA-binding protein
MARTRSRHNNAASGEFLGDFSRPPRSSRRWLADEHARYLTAIELYPQSSWKVIADLVGTRTVRQVISHAQKIAQKQKRHARGLHRAGRRPRQPDAPEVQPSTNTAPAARRRNRPRRSSRQGALAEGKTSVSRIDVKAAVCLSDSRFLATASASTTEGGAMELEGDCKSPMHAPIDPIPLLSSSPTSGNAFDGWSEADIAWLANIQGYVK